MMEYLEKLMGCELRLKLIERAPQKGFPQIAQNKDKFPAYDTDYRRKEIKERKSLFHLK